ncbi:MAG: hypothetical protein WCP19_06755, partial [Chloroflexota bacterium]
NECAAYPGITVRHGADFATGDLFYTIADISTDNDIKLNAYNKALAAYQTETELLINKNLSPLKSMLAVANIYELLAQYEKARTVYIQMEKITLQSAPADVDWNIYYKISKLSQKLNDPDMRIRYLNKAIDIVPSSQKQTLIDELLNIKP